MTPFLPSSWEELPLALIGAVAGVALSLPVIRWQIKTAKRLAGEQISAARSLAEEQGTLRKPCLEGYLAHPELKEMAVLAIDHRPDHPFVVALPLVIQNNGKKAAKGVSVIVRLPQICGNFRAVEAADLGLAEFMGVKMQVLGEEEGASLVGFGVETLPVGLPMRLLLPVAFPIESLLELSSKVRSSDGFEAEVEGVVVCAYPISVFISDEDGETFAFSRSFQTVRGSVTEARNYVDGCTRRAIAMHRQGLLTRFEEKFPETRGETVEVTVATLVAIDSDMVEDNVDIFGFEGGYLYLGYCRDGKYWIPPLGTSRYGRELDGPAAPEGLVPAVAGSARLPRISFVDGEEAAPYLLIDLQAEKFFKMRAHFKDWDELQAVMTPKVHARLVQLLEVLNFNQAIAKLDRISHELQNEMAPQYARYGVRLKKLEVSCLVRELP